MYYHVLFASIVTHPSLNRSIQGHGKGGGWWSLIYHRANTDNHALTFTSPVNFIVSNLPNMHSADLGLLKTHTDKERTLNLKRQKGSGCSSWD